MSSMSVILFFGGWLPILNIFPFILIPGYFWFSFKTILMVFFFILVRAAFPRYRYDQLMHLGWKVFLPLSLGFLFFYASVLYGFNGL
jgi:NADH-quinone oxidoreductase subunit H